MPKVAMSQVVWRAVDDTYGVQEDGTSAPLAFQLGSQAWFVWLDAIPSFAFSGPHGRFTARKEPRGRGESYWYAYRGNGKKVAKRYLGKTGDLTRERLEQVAASLSLVDGGTVPIVVGPDTPSRNSPLRDPLLATKLRVPLLRARLVERDHLVRRLRRGLIGPLTLLSAPAGFGKTSLLAEALVTCDMPVAWLSLEPSDNDPSRFLAYLIAALQTAQPAVGGAALALLRTPGPPRIDTALSLLAEDLAREATGPLVLALDDYHVVTAEAIHHAVAYLVEQLSPPLHLAIATRVDPPLPLARLRARSHLTELRSSDLRFSRQEVSTFLRDVMDVHVSEEEIAALETRTEGWIAGLQLAGLSLQGRPDVAEFVAGFTGSHRFVLDYLMEEVLARQTPEVQEFLLRTSVLERLTAPLCQAVTGQEECAALLERLDRANAFLVPLDDEREWYRYHHLFAEAMRARLHLTRAALLPELHRRASGWFEAHGFLDEAITHALAAGDYSAATRVIERSFRPALRRRTGFRTLIRWVESLPLGWLDTHQHLAVYYAWVLLVSRARPRGEIEEWMRRTINSASDSGLSEVAAQRGELAALSALDADYAEDHARTLELAHESLTLLPSDHWMRAVMLVDEGYAALALGRAAEALAIFEHAVSRSGAEEWQLVELIARSLLANAHVVLGHLGHAAHLYQEVLREGPAENPPIRGLAHARGGLGDVLREWNELDAALGHLRVGSELQRYMGGLTTTALAVHIPLARVYLAQGRWGEAREELDRLEAVAREAAAPHTLALAATWRARAALMQGDISAAERWAGTRGLHIEAPLPTEDEVAYDQVALATLARLVIAQNRAQEALPLLDLLQAQAVRSGQVPRNLEALALCALALEATGQENEALATLRRALELAESEGYVRVFVDEGQAMKTLLETIQQSALALDAYVDKLLAAFDGRSAELGDTDRAVRGTTVGSAHDALLSERELEVLRLVAAGVSNADIARQLVIEVSTVKRHVSNILTKLGAANRTEAAARARGIGLL